MMNVIQFPRSKARSSFGVRAVASVRLPGMFEVQRLEGGAWRAESLYPSQEAATAAARKIIEAIAVSRLDGGDAA